MSHMNWFSQEIWLSIYKNGVPLYIKSYKFSFPSFSMMRGSPKFIRKNECKLGRLRISLALELKGMFIGSEITGPKGPRFCWHIITEPICTLPYHFLLSTTSVLHGMTPFMALPFSSPPQDPLTSPNTQMNPTKIHGGGGFCYKNTSLFSPLPPKHRELNVPESEMS